MTARLVLLLLVAAAIVAIVGRLRNLPRPAPRPKPVEVAEKCPSCGAYRIAGSRCDCEGASRS